MMFATIVLVIQCGILQGYMLVQAGMLRQRTTTDPVPGMPRPDDVSKEEKRFGKTMWAWRGPYDIGKLESYIYDPTAGYEPYWIEGHWIINPTNVTTLMTGGPNCPFTECPESYKQFGPICAGWEDHKGLYNFENICEMLKADCGSEWLYMALYRGECIQPEDLRYFMYPWSMTRNIFGMFNNANRAKNAIEAYFKNSYTTQTWTHHTRTWTIPQTTSTKN